MPITFYVFLTVCPSTIFILCIVIKLSTTNDIQIHSFYNYAALQNNPKARNYSDSEVSQHGKRKSVNLGPT
jgi:hypothetical protein